jgi:HSP20 family protein
MPVLKYNPFLELETVPSTLREFQETVSRLMNEPNGVRPWTPAVDILETEDALKLRADLPGVDMNAIDVRLENGTLTLKGERKFENEEKGKGYHRIERAYGSFARSFTLPESMDVEKVKADYKNGVLTVTVPKKEVAKPRTVKVEVSGE